ncbi:MAG: hypothetical protein RLZZ37_169 [Actinomycetota bacterium]|jgi:uncharacterized protein YlxW (UPF0749 family)
MAKRKLKKKNNSQKYYLVLIMMFLGLLITWSIRQNDEPEVLTSAREDELVLILDDLVKQTDSLEQELVKQQQVLESLQNGSSDQAREAAQRRLDQLIVLSGSAPVSGPGLQIRITGDLYSVSAFTLLDAIQELRDAGAVAIEINANRVVSNTYFLDAPDGIKVSQKTIRSPYIINVIGDPSTLETALRIPGGIVETIQTSDGTVVINKSTTVDIDSIVTLEVPEYAVS